MVMFQEKRTYKIRKVIEFNSNGIKPVELRRNYDQQRNMLCKLSIQETNANFGTNLR